MVSGGRRARQLANAGETLDRIDPAVDELSDIIEQRNERLAKIGEYLYQFSQAISEVNSKIDASTESAHAGISDLETEIQRTEEAYDNIREAVEKLDEHRIDITPMVQEGRNQVYKQLNLVLALLLVSTVISAVALLIMR